MKHILSFVFAVFAATAVLAQDEGGTSFDDLIFNADEINLSELMWIKRSIVVFADTPADPRFIEQMEYLRSRPEALTSRDVVVITDTDPAARSEFRRKLRPRGFVLVLMGKDGEIYLRKPAPWHVREIVRSIDKLPARQREMREGSAGDT